MVFKFYNPGKIQDKLIRNVCVSLRLSTGWAFVKDDASKSYDLIHCPVCIDETPCQAGLRILKEKFHLEPDSILEVCPYSVDMDGEVSYGMLLFAKVENVSAGVCPPFEIFAKLPDKLSRGEATRRLFTGTQGWLNMQTNKLQSSQKKWLMQTSFHLKKHFVCYPFRKLKLFWNRRIIF